MKFQGKVFNWNDDKGFGFVEPNGGGERAFVHIKAFKPRSRRPVNGELIIYELVCEHNNRYTAENIKFAREVRSSNQRSKTNGGSRFGGAFTIAFCIGLLGFVFSGKLPAIIIGWYFVMSLITFIAYALDKAAAQKGRWRTKESTLHIFSLIGGWPGAFIAQNKLRHKSKKKDFQNVYWATVFINSVGLFLLYLENGENLVGISFVPLLNG